MTIRIATSADILSARDQGRALAARLGFSTGDATLIATAVSDLARRILEGTGDGEIVLIPLEKAGRIGLCIECVTAGQGVDVERMRRFGEDLEITTEAGKTRVQLRKWVQRRTTSRARPEKSKRLLVADDDPLVLATLEQILLRTGYAVTAVKSGAEALHRLTSEPIDLAILDVLMPPGLSGLEVCRRIRQDERTREIPVILMTAQASVEAQVEGQVAGSDLYLVKPVEMDRLLAVVEMFTESRAD